MDLHIIQLKLYCHGSNVSTERLETLFWTSHLGLVSVSASYVSFTNLAASLMFVYLCSLVDSLTDGKKVTSDSLGEQITDGIVIKPWDAKHNNETITFSVWDFAGQTIYYNTHQVSLQHVFTVWIILVFMILLASSR